MRGRSWLFGLIWGMAGILLSAQLSFGAGFALYEFSARGDALGGGLVARADDPSALAFNPAGITQLPGIQIMTGATVIIPSTDVVTHGTILGGTATETTSTGDNAWVPPHLYTTYQFSDKLWFGLGIFSPFGLGTEFVHNWPGAFNSYRADIVTVTINPNIALKLNDWVSVSAGAEAMYFDLTLMQQRLLGVIPTNPPTLVTSEQTLKGDSWGYGYNFGLRVQPSEYVAFGASYRSQVKQKVEGDVDFTGLLTPLSSGANGSITLPDEVFLGVAIYPMPKLSFEVGGVWTRWSTFSALSLTTDKGLSTTVAKEWRDVWRLNVSAEYKLLDWLDLRTSYVFDEEPIPGKTVDYLVPGNNRHLFSFGPGFHWGNWGLDLSYTYLLIEDRDVQGRAGSGVLDGEFKNGNAHLIGTSISYKF